MIEVSFDIDNGLARFRDTVRAEDIARAAAIAESRYPEHDIRLALPVDPGRFFAGERKPVEPYTAIGRRG